MRPRALDLFCGAGGATAGLQRAGFEVIGIDHNPRRAKRYCGHFICADALAPPVRLADYDLIWASPPCQRYTNIWLGQEYMRDRYPNLIPATRALLQSSGVPWVIENVPGAPLRADVVLTGAVFGLDIVRKRLFEVQGFEPPFILLQEHFQKTVSNGDLACVAGQGANNAWNVRRKADKRASQAKATKWRHLPEDLKTRLRERNSVAGWGEAIGIDWMTRDELREAVPPAYAEFIARRAIEAMGEKAAA